MNLFKIFIFSVLSCLPLCLGGGESFKNQSFVFWNTVLRFVLIEEFPQLLHVGLKQLLHLLWGRVQSLPDRDGAANCENRAHITLEEQHPSLGPQPGSPVGS